MNKLWSSLPAQIPQIALFLPPKISKAQSSEIDRSKAHKTIPAESLSKMREALLKINPPWEERLSSELTRQILWDISELWRSLAILIEKGNLYSDMPNMPVYAICGIFADAILIQLKASIKSGSNGEEFYQKIAPSIQQACINMQTLGAEPFRFILHLVFQAEITLDSLTGFYWVLPQNVSEIVLKKFTIFASIAHIQDVSELSARIWEILPAELWCIWQEILRMNISGAWACYRIRAAVILLLAKYQELCYTDTVWAPISKNGYLKSWGLMIFRFISIFSPYELAFLDETASRDNDLILEDEAFKRFLKSPVVVGDNLTWEVPISEFFNQRESHLDAILAPLLPALGWLTPEQIDLVKHYIWPIQSSPSIPHGLWIELAKYGIEYIDNFEKIQEFFPAYYETLENATSFEGKITCINLLFARFVLSKRHPKVKPAEFLDFLAQLSIDDQYDFRRRDWSAGVLRMGARIQRVNPDWDWEYIEHLSQLCDLEQSYFNLFWSEKWQKLREALRSMTPTELSAIVSLLKETPISSEGREKLLAISSDISRMSALSLSERAVIIDWLSLSALRALYSENGSGKKLGRRIIDIYFRLWKAWVEEHITNVQGFKNIATFLGDCPNIPEESKVRILEKKWAMALLLSRRELSEWTDDLQDFFLQYSRCTEAFYYLSTTRSIDASLIGLLTSLSLSDFLPEDMDRTNLKHKTVKMRAALTPELVSRVEIRKHIFESTGINLNIYFEAFDIFTPVGDKNMQKVFSQSDWIWLFSDMSRFEILSQIAKRSKDGKIRIAAGDISQLAQYMRDIPGILESYPHESHLVSSDSLLAHCAAIVSYAWTRSSQEESEKILGQDALVLLEAIFDKKSPHRYTLYVDRLTRFAKKFDLSSYFTESNLDLYAPLDREWDSWEVDSHTSETESILSQIIAFAEDFVQWDHKKEAIHKMIHRYLKESTLDISALVEKASVFHFLGEGMELAQLLELLTSKEKMENESLVSQIAESVSSTVDWLNSSGESDKQSFRNKSVPEMINFARKHGFIRTRVRGSHMIFHHRESHKMLVIPVNAKSGTIQSIWNQIEGIDSRSVVKSKR
jgi:predicted RNA binding protein YcfA (HicA-like mRNA interferase family)